ncbi:ABC-type sugar transport system permease subunit [Hydrogenispora ethanolica]|uniref:ABC-type sugar transport system permease subunit n=1 Tax=Hydrogenispora ethanolica TaxID=1082276 RepID=A0A4R1R0H0_HYDET|nr:sugar ABC transporter permease [Hydrogenispora ethanolica]TCL58803.1 ABC-type sugar transport system permease subunit [Hydrogenispora ethanolica]
MIAASSDRNRRILEWTGHYLWILPAAVLVFFFLILPTFQTIYLSLNQEVSFSESEFRQYVLDELKTASGREVTRYDLFREIPGWQKALARIEAHYRIRVAPGEIDAAMTVKDTVELLTIAINQALQENGNAQQFVGLKNYAAMLADRNMLTAFKNNLLWLVVFTLFTVSLGLAIAALADRVRWATLAKTIIFMPMAISGVAAGVIWNFMYFKDVHTGTLNALLNLLVKVSPLPVKTFEGIAFLGRPELVNLALIAAGVWMQVGFCTVIFGAALKAVPVELLEMARIEGAKNLQVFFKIELPIIQSTIVVVVTQMIIWVLRVFDIIYALTKGGPFNSSEVVANRMYMTAFNEGNFQYAAAMAVILFIAVIPILIMNIRNLAYEDSVRE